MKQYVLGLALLIVPLVALPTSHANAQSQAEMNRQAAKDFEKVDAELNSAYAALMAKLPDAESKQKLKESQRAWLAFRDAEAAFQADGERGGSMALLIYSTTASELTQAHIEALRKQLSSEQHAKKQ